MEPKPQLEPAAARSLHLIDYSYPPSWEQIRSGGPPAPPMRILNILNGAMLTQCIYVAMRLQIADKLSVTSMTKDELAEECGAVPERLERLMSALIASGVFELDDQVPGCYKNNEMSAVLSRDHPNCMSAAVGFIVEDTLGAWNYLYEAITEGGTVYTSQKVNQGKTIWEHFAENPAQAAQFDSAMTTLDNLGARAVILDGPFASVNRLVDMGGSRGHFLAKILRTYPHINGVLFDLPTVIAQSTRPAWTDGEYSDILDRVELMAGSFFELDTMPAVRDGDVFMFRYVLHDWDDESCTQILTNLRAKIGPAQGVRVFICEVVLPERNSAVDRVASKYFMDLQMCVLAGAKERSLSEWNSLLELTGFVSVAVHPTRSLVHVIEATTR